MDNKLYHTGEVDRLGFEESKHRMDEYLDKEFMVMRANGLGDWGILSSLPRILKEKYPDCRVYVPSPKLLDNLFGHLK